MGPWERTAAALLAGSLLAGCIIGDVKIPDERMDADYYFDGQATLIQGRGRMPAPRVNVPPADAEGNTKSETQFLSFAERQELCRKEARLDAHSKWLSLSDRDWQDIAEWRLRLGMGARGPWSDCLDGARELGFYLDGPEICRVALLVRCAPDDY